MNTQESMREYPTLEIRADLSLDEPSDRSSLPSRTAQKGFELFANDFMEKGPFGFVAFVSDGGKQFIGTLKAGLSPAIADPVERCQSAVTVMVQVPPEI